VQAVARLMLSSRVHRRMCGTGTMVLRRIWPGAMRSTAAWS
jgi:hypothetical protein